LCLIPTTSPPISTNFPFESTNFFPIPTTPSMLSTKNKPHLQLALYLSLYFHLFKNLPFPAINDIHSKQNLSFLHSTKKSRTFVFTNVLDLIFSYASCFAHTICATALAATSNASSSISNFG